MALWLAVVAAAALASLVGSLAFMRLEDRAERARDRAEDARRYEGLAAALGDLASALVTPAVAARLELCARTTAVLLLVLRGGDLANAGTCSAVPLFAGAGVGAAAGQVSSTLFLTSAHCFHNESLENSVAPVYFSARVEHGEEASPSCTLLRHFWVPPGAPSLTPSLDLAIVRCAAPLNVPPTVLTKLPYHARQPAALLGFSTGLHRHSSMFTRYTLGGVRIAPHVRYTHLASSLQLPLQRASGASGALSPAGVQGAASPASDVMEHEHIGFVVDTPEKGMSGGALVDMQCGLIGINEKGSTSGGVGGGFVNLSPSVVAMISRALASGLEGSPPVIPYAMVRLDVQ